ncbi:hypothetical protein [Streptomyces lavendofoliae]|uniref:hypothetical protein n=1 Tax=Streptomyces lavendofoliae TaxID=67314 RepID=UPI00300F0890
MDDAYCGTTPPGATPSGGTGHKAGGHTAAEPAAGPPYAACVLCQEPTEYPESAKGVTLCPVCEWREAERTACSG